MTAPLNLRDLEALARERMQPGPFAFYFGGAADEVTLRENEAAFECRRLRPRVLLDVARRRQSVELLGTRVRLPVGVAPTGQHGFAHADAEVATARAAAQAGALFCLATGSTRPMEEVAEASGDAPRWFQLYTQSNRGITEDLVRRAAAAGFGALVVTVDLPVGGRRERADRAGFQLTSPRTGNFARYGDEQFAELTQRSGYGMLTWDDLAWLRGIAPLPLVLKGILTADDARLAVEHGAAAVWVSNHGGRQLDRSPASIDVLEEIVEAVDGRAEVYLDGGVRRGVDVVTALALGARAVFIGRPALYALAWNGADGVAAMLLMLALEVDNAMALLGVTSLDKLTRAHVM
ncbi:MAG: alpha-hydroxy acid oxidase [Dehalococcoidia bacterium]